MNIPIPRIELMRKAAKIAVSEAQATDKEFQDLLDPHAKEDMLHTAEMVKWLIDRYGWLNQTTALDIVLASTSSIGRHVGNQFQILQQEFAEEYLAKNGDGACPACGGQTTSPKDDPEGGDEPDGSLQ